MLSVIKQLPGQPFGVWRHVVVQDFRAWLTKNGLTAGIYVAAGLGLFLIARGVIEFLT